MKRKGFTLIELLAVIVILAIIALIATPIVLNIIEDSKLSAAKDSAMVISKAAETYYMSQTTLEGEEVLEIYLKDDIIKYKGEKPEKGYVTFDSKGNSYLKMYKDGYCIVSDFDNTVIADKMDSKECMLPNEVPAPPLKDGQIVYFNPITNSFCDTYAKSTNSKNGFRGTTDNGCMLWHVFLDTEEAETIKLLLDHNTSTTELSLANANAEIANAKENNLYGWHADVRSTIRLISALEVNQIAPTSSGVWNPANSDDYHFHTGTYSVYTGAPGKYGWLYDNTEWCNYYGCNIGQDGQWGYWTSTARNSSYNWGILYYGELYDYSVTSTYYYGVRPVIELPKSKFKDEEWEPLTYTVTFKEGDNVVGTKEVEYKTFYGDFPTLEKEGYELVWKLNGMGVGEDTLIDRTSEHVIEAEWKEITYLAKLYFNPITNSACTETDYNAVTNSISGFRGTSDNGCMLWYAYKEDGDNYLMIADHNTSTGYKFWDEANAEIANARDNNLYGWHAEVRSTIRMISAYEITEIAPFKEGWEWSDNPIWYNLHTGEIGSEDLGKSGSKYAWLFDNLRDCIEAGCNIESGSQSAYWTSTEKDDEDYIIDDEYESHPYAWEINYNGELDYSSSNEGVRPVISVPKSKFAN